MDIKAIKGHAYAFLMGLAGAVATSAALAALNYIGAHIPDAINFITTIGGASAAVKYTA